MNLNNSLGYEQTIIVNNMAEARKKLYEQYGQDYNIKYTRQILSPGFLGFGQKSKLQVTYEVKKRESSYDVKTSVYDSFNKNKEELIKKTTNTTIENLLLNAKLEDKLNDISNKIEKISANSAEKPASIQKIEEMLAKNEFSIKYINYITDKIKKSFPLDQLEDFSLVQEKVVDWIGESILIAEKKVYRKPYVAIIVGPTGIGKTTTLVKLAVNYMVENRNNGTRPKICFITIDSMKVGAFEQVKKFGDLLDIDVKKAEKAEDVKFIYEEAKDYVDAIFIDTSGYSPNDASHLGSMKMTLNVPGINPDVFLAISASTKSRDIENIMQNYEPFGYKSVIITKCDESDQLGNVLSVLFDKHKKVSYITMGQQLAGSKHIKYASVIDFLIRLEDFEIDREHIEAKFGDK